jgi:hypothetical protein
MRRPAQVGALWRAGIGFMVLACSERSRPLPQGFADAPMEEHTALGAAFVSGDSGALRRLLHPDLIVQPPVPDSAQQGNAAIEYLLELAAHTAASESRLEPSAVVPEGPFVFEQGSWLLRSGDRRVRGAYTLRWRATPEGWRVVLWRWGVFQ